MTTLVRIWRYEGEMKEKRLLSSVDPRDEVPGAELVAAIESQDPPSIYLCAPEMLELLRLASWPVCRRTGYEDCGLCDTCRARALIAKIEEV